MAQRNLSRPVSRVDERPRTRWTRDDRTLTRGLAEDRPSVPDMRRGSAAVDDAPLVSSRPISRRGAKDNADTMSSMSSAVPDRPITGMVRPPSTTAIKGTGLKPVGTGVGGASQRQVQDRSYYMGMVRAAMGELSAEIAKLKTQSDEVKAEKAASLVFEKRVRELAEELTGLQEQLSDYNLLVDRLNTGAEASDVNMEIAEVARESDKIAHQVDALFAKKQTLEDESNDLKDKLKQEQQITEKLVSQLDAEGRQRFTQLQQNTIRLDAKADEMQAQLDAMSVETKELEDKINHSEIHQESLRLRRRLLELSVRRDALSEEERKRQSPGQQRDALLAAVKAHNAELAALDAQTEREKQTVASLNESITHASQALEQNSSERTSQYSEMKRKEAAIEDFLAGFEVAKQQEEARRSELEHEVGAALAKYAALLVKAHNLPSVEAYGELKEQLGMKEGEVEKAKFTTQGLGQQEAHLKAQMTRVLELEEKVAKETETIRTKLLDMEAEKEKFSDVAGLRAGEEERRRKVEARRSQVERDLRQRQQHLRDAHAHLNALQKALAENDVWTQLSHVQHKWAQAAQNNHALAEYVAAHHLQNNFQPLVQKATDLIARHNQILKNAQMRSN
ncbi:intraflagellar transport protein 74 homolog [Neocloeon triangulifer]|uniref:intraflagellar transport protein 74 homolog n=1 Tax=Neocloeon triangulifer TaxID=2078957 RepID=UPI00286F54E2|nr:intraflagellar transport protein 74 homolog [Neocloeon triangulifer]